tara:strand:- start:36 stop:353 length:318 start_codon:yes stop_codon:yes gene_type:complete
MTEKWIKFVDASDDIHWIPGRNIHAMHIADDNDVVLHFRNWDGPAEAVSDAIITITDTGEAPALADNIAAFLADAHVRSTSLLTIKASGTGISSTVSTVAYTVGS